MAEGSVRIEFGNGASAQCESVRSLWIDGVEVVFHENNHSYKCIVSSTFAEPSPAPVETGAQPSSTGEILDELAAAEMKDGLYDAPQPSSESSELPLAPPWRASYCWMRDQRDAALAQVDALRTSHEALLEAAKKAAEWIRDDGTYLRFRDAIDAAAEKIAAPREGKK